MPTSASPSHTPQFTSLNQFLNRQKYSFRFANRYLSLPSSICEIESVDCAQHKTLLLYHLLAEVLLSLLHLDKASGSLHLSSKKNILLLDFRHEFCLSEFYIVIDAHMKQLAAQHSPTEDYDENVLIELLQCLEVPRCSTHAQLCALLQQMRMGSTRHTDLLILNDLNTMRDLPMHELPTTHLSQELRTHFLHSNAKLLCSLVSHFQLSLIAFKLPYYRYSKQAKSVAESILANPSLAPTLNQSFMPHFWTELVDQTVYVFSPGKDRQQVALLTDSHCSSAQSIHIEGTTPFAHQSHLLLTLLHLDAFNMRFDSHRLVRRSRKG